jgi:hypothetical protein
VFFLRICHVKQVNQFVDFIGGITTNIKETTDYGHEEENNEFYKIFANNGQISAPSFGKHNCLARWSQWLIQETSLKLQPGSLWHIQTQTSTVKIASY